MPIFPPPPGLGVLADLGLESTKADRTDVRLNGPDEARDRDDIDAAGWHHPGIEGRNWDRRYPYQLLVLDRQKDGTYARRGDWMYTLPIPPESLTISTNFAINTVVTQGGIVEEHGGFPLKPIDIQGTTGVLPARPSAGQPGRTSLVATVFAGTIAALDRVANAAQDLATDLTGDARKPSNLIPDELLDDQETSNSLLKNTGYWQARMMVRFLEAYATLKRSLRGKDAVLALACWKDEAVYLVTPNRVQLRKASDSPMEYRYQIALTAWGRVKIQGPAPSAPRTVREPTDPSVLQDVLNALTDAQRVLQESRKAIEAVAADADRVIFEPVREAILLTKDALNVPLALVDLPASIVHDAADTVVAAVAAGEDVLDFPDALDAESQKTKRSIQDDVRRIREALGSSLQDRTTVGTGTAASNKGRVAGQPLLPKAPTPALDIFDRPSNHPDLLGAIRPDKLRLSPEVRTKIAAEVTRVRRLTTDDLKERRRTVQEAAATFEDLVGAGDATYARTLGRQAPKVSQPLSRRNFQVAASLASVVLSYAQLVARGPRTADAGVLGTMRVFADQASRAGIPFQVPRSKLPVPFPYGSTLEQLAQRYLGTPDRWHEIAALNGLRAPYVDEVGVATLLQAPGAGRRVVVADSTDLHVGQTVWIESRTVARVKRRVVALDRDDGLVTVTMDGAEDLDRFSPLDGAALRHFLPGTINSQMLVFIPSDQEPDGTFRVNGVASVDIFDPLTSAGGVDLLLTPSNDLVVTPDGDNRWAVGLTALTQLFRVLMQLRRGTLLHHPDKGLPLRPGESIADAPASVVARAVRETIASEPAFSIVKEVSVKHTPPTTRVDVAVEVAGGSLTLPLSVDAVR
jgi:hypothetical protein